jgi:DNA-directed RNA polymerase
LNQVKQPLQPGREQQIELEQWCSAIGASRALADGWEKGAGNCLADKLVAIYLKKVRELYHRSKTRPGRQAHVWDMMHSDKAVDHVAVESLCFVFSNLRDDWTYQKLALTLGKRAEYVLWLTHPSWGKKLHLRGLKLASNNDLGMTKILDRLKSAGFRKAASYRKLQGVERAALGGFFVECIAMSTKMIEIYMKKGPKKMMRMVTPSSLYWDFQSRWKESLKLYRTIRLPMLIEPKPWTDIDDGGYLTQQLEVSNVGWERWPEVSKQMLPCVLNTVNTLQSVPHVLDHGQADFERLLWESGHALGGLPSKNRLLKPNWKDKKEQGVSASDYWKAVWQWKADARRNHARIGFVHGAISYSRLINADQLHWVWFLDHRGRCYARGGQLNPQGPDHMRSLIRFKDESPLKGNEAAFAWSLGEAYGLQADWDVRKNYLLTMSHILHRIGEDPMEHLAYLDGAKEPFRFVQLCRDWHGFIKDPGYTSGTIHWLDQTCSGWGHVACLTGDGVLARFTNVTGTRKSDLYAGLGKLIMTYVKWMANNPDHPDLVERQVKCARWWVEHDPSRSFWKMTLMPVIYGQTYMSLDQKVSLYLRDEVKDFLTSKGLRVVDLSMTICQAINKSVKEALPNNAELAQWLAHTSSLQIDAGIRPCWFTPNGLAVESFVMETKQDSMGLDLAGRSISFNLSEPIPGKFNKARTARKLVPDFVHSQDAAFMQRFVSHWTTYKRPISTVHDCFGTNLGAVSMMRQELCDQWARFYSVDHLARHQAMVASTTGMEVKPPPSLGTLKRNDIGTNPFLFT